MVCQSIIQHARKLAHKCKCKIPVPYIDISRRPSRFYNKDAFAHLKGRQQLTIAQGIIFYNENSNANWSTKPLVFRARARKCGF